MQIRPKQDFCSVYAPRKVSEDFPVSKGRKEKYKLDDQDISTPHFHNYLEIGYCFDGGGTFLILTMRSFYLAFHYKNYLK